VLQLSAQDPSHLLYGEEDGLPSSEVYNLCLDKHGMLWLSSDRGVCSFDGYEFKCYNTSDGLAHNTNFIITSDKNEDLWFAGFDGSLTRYDYEEFLPYAKNDELKLLNPGVWMVELLFDSANNLIFRLNEDRISLPNDISKLTLPYYKIDFLLDSILHFNVSGSNTAYHTSENDNWIKLKVDENYLLIDKQTQFFSGPKIISDENNFVSLSRVQEYSNRNAKYEIKQTIEDSTTTILVTENRLVDIFTDRLGNIIIGTDNGILVFEAGDLSQEPKRLFEGYFITCIIQDENCNYWFSTLKNGILFVPTLAVNGIFNEPEEDRYGELLSIEALSDYLVIGTYDGSILSVDKEHKVELVFKNILSVAISNLYARDNTLFSSYYIKVVENSTGLKALQDEWYLSSHRFVKELSDGSVFTAGKWIFIHKEHEVTFDSRKLEKPFTAHFRCIEEDSLGNLFIGTVTGLYKLAGENYNQLIDLSLSHKSLGSYISDIKNFRGNNLLIATIGNGLLYLTPDTIYQFTEADGLASNLINNILVIDDNNIWLGTNQGLDKIRFRIQGDSLEINIINSYNSTNGLPYNNVTDIAVWNELLWIICGNALYYFDPIDLEPCITSTNIYLTEMWVNDHIIDLTDETVLNYNENDLSLEFKGILFSKPLNEDFYRYKLVEKGKVDNWSYSNETKIHYSNLGAGDYIFQANPRNSDGSWSEQYIEKSICIRPHITEQLWFRILIFFLTCLILAYLFYRWNKSRIWKTDQERLIHEATIRMKNAELAMLRKQMNPHFIFNALNAIQNYIFDKDIAKANYYLTDFSKLMRSSIEMSKLENISLKDEMTFLNTYLELELLRFPGLFDYELILDEEISEFHHQVPPLLLQPLLENAIKHGFKGINYKGMLLLKIELPEENPAVYHISIIDNGHGIKKTEAISNQLDEHKSFSLKIIQERIKIINDQLGTMIAVFELKDRQPGKGTQIKLIIPAKMIS